MSLDAALLALRAAIAVALYAFLGTLLIFIWRDIRAVSQQQEDSRRHTQARLVVVSCEDVPLQVGYVYPLQPVTTLGRGPSNTIVLPDSFASTEHACITLKQGRWWLDDLQSRNGTTLNGVPVSGAVVLSAGDEIGIGRVRFRFESG